MPFNKYTYICSTFRQSHENDSLWILNMSGNIHKNFTANSTVQNIFMKKMIDSGYLSAQIPKFNHLNLFFYHTILFFSHIYADHTTTIFCGLF